MCSLSIICIQINQWLQYAHSEAFKKSRQRFDHSKFIIATLQQKFRQFFLPDIFRTWRSSDVCTIVHKVITVLLQDKVPIYLATYPKTIRDWCKLKPCPVCLFATPIVVDFCFSKSHLFHTLKKLCISNKCELMTFVPVSKCTLSIKNNKPVSYTLRLEMSITPIYSLTQLRLKLHYLFKPKTVRASQGWNSLQRF